MNVALLGGLTKSAYYSDEFVYVSIITLLHQIILVSVYDVEQ